MVLVVALVVVVVAAARSPSPSRGTTPPTHGAARFVDAVSYGQRGHLRIAQTGELDVIVYDSSRVLSWIVAYGRAHAGARLCLSGAGVAATLLRDARAG